MTKSRKIKKENKEKASNSVDSLKRKVEIAFSATNTTIYNRDKEIEKITAFLNSKDKILNIVGVPGTGKTSTVLNICKNIKKFKYLNFYKEPSIKKVVLKNKYDLVIIDEFDKFYQSKLADSRFVIHHVTSHGGKLITLGNNLEFESSSVIFKPYTGKEIEEIIKLKIEKEVGSQIISNLDLKILCRKHSNGGDMRSIFKYILTNFDSETGMVTVYRENQAQSQENLSNEDEEVSIHHKIILKTGSQVDSKVQAFKLYFNECEDYGIPPLPRMLFYELFDTLCYK